MKFLREVALITAAISIALLFLDVVLLLLTLFAILVVPVLIVHGVYKITKQLFQLR